MQDNPSDGGFAALLNTLAEQHGSDIDEAVSKLRKSNDILFSELRRLHEERVSFVTDLEAKSLPNRTPHPDEKNISSGTDPEAVRNELAHEEKSRSPTDPDELPQLPHGVRAEYVVDTGVAGAVPNVVIDDNPQPVYCIAKANGTAPLETINASTSHSQTPHPELAGHEGDELEFFQHGRPPELSQSVLVKGNTPTSTTPKLKRDVSAVSMGTVSEMLPTTLSLDNIVFQHKTNDILDVNFADFPPPSLCMRLRHRLIGLFNNNSHKARFLHYHAELEVLHKKQQCITDDLYDAEVRGIRETEWQTRCRHRELKDMFNILNGFLLEYK